MIARSYGLRDARFSAFPTFMMVSMGRGGAGDARDHDLVRSGAPRLDQIAAVDQLVREAERGEVAPADGIRRLGEIVD